MLIESVILFNNHVSSNVILKYYITILFRQFSKILKIDTGKKKLSNKTPMLTKSMNMGIWVVCTSNQPLT